MKKIVLIFLFTLSLSAKTITPNDVYALSIQIQEHMHYLLNFYNIEHNHDEIIERGNIRSVDIQPRHTWQKSYEILIKINIFRAKHNLARIEPVGIEAVLKLHPDMVYEMQQRILTELKILEIRNDIPIPHFKIKKFKKKIPLDIYNMLMNISAGLDELNKKHLSPSYVFAESMRIYDDLTIILNHLNIKDLTSPDSTIMNAIPRDALNTSFKVLNVIAEIQVSVGITAIDFSEFNRHDITPGEVYTLTGLIISELQTIKAYIGLQSNVTPPAYHYMLKKPKNVEQLMRWNLKRLQLIKKLHKGEK